MNRINTMDIHVVLDFKGRWKVQDNENHHVLGSFNQKEDALIIAEKISKDLKQSFYIHNEDGTVNIIKFNDHI